MSDRNTDRHKTPRAYESGAQKRKKAAEKTKKGKNILEHTQKLSSYFKRLKPTASTSEVSQNTLTELEGQTNEEADAACDLTTDEAADAACDLTTDEAADAACDLTTDEGADAACDLTDDEGADAACDLTTDEAADTARDLTAEGGAEAGLEVAAMTEADSADDEMAKAKEVHDVGRSKGISSFQQCNDVGLWPKKCCSEFIDFWATEGSKRLQHCTFKQLQKSVTQRCKKRENRSMDRKCSKQLFIRKKRNGESVNRSWLCFSPSQGKVYCYVCKLITPQKENLSGEGFSDWKHAHVRMAEHEISKSHLNSVTVLGKRVSEKQSISAHLLRHSEDARAYWRHVLMRVVCTIKFLAERGLAFRGENELLNSPRNGNFMGIMELIAEFDPFLSSHLKGHAQKGRGKTNYLSSTIVEEIIKLMGQRVQQTIIDRIKQSKYYSVSVDSTPDEANIDQLTIVIRYIEGSTPKERFLTFLPNCGHTGSAIANGLLTFLEQHKVEIRDCRGQAYDNAANMCGKYKGMQAFIKEKNKLAELIPCCGHSLNLVGKAAANACPKAVHFFQFVQQLYVFFTASTHRYQILKTHLSQSGAKYSVPKPLSETRWACRADATKALVHGYHKIKDALDKIGCSTDEKDIVKNEANSLSKQMSSLDIAFLFSGMKF
ncbi:zinc finger protein 862-like [Engystomops pustulosus]|uniref:zinc finger protein 862-like n=1 Tax=Engystomops pustulosus TaxID=76066 RepID=UPI003AFB6461